MTLGVGKLEAKIVIPSGGLSCQLTDSTGGPYSISFTAGDEYYQSSIGTESYGLAAELKDKFQTAGAGALTYSVNLSDTTGKYTITVSSGTFSVTWTDTALRNLFGFDAAISSKVTVTGADQAEALWFPQSPVSTPYGLNSAGMPVSAATIRMAPDGTYTAIHGPKMTRQQLQWVTVQNTRVIQAEETTTNASYESFWLHAIRGEKSWAQSGAIRWYPDLTDDATYKTYNVTEAISPGMERLDPNWEGLWTVNLDLVEAV